MPVITFAPSGKAVEVTEGTTLLAAAQLAGVKIETPCGGEGACGDCAVRVTEGDVEKELGVLSVEEIADGLVLACGTKIKKSAVTVLVPDRIELKSGQFAESVGDKRLVADSLLPKEFKQISERVFLHVKGSDDLCDLEVLTRAVSAGDKSLRVEYPLPIIQKIADALRAEDGEVTVTTIRTKGQCQVIQVEPGRCSPEHLGIAVDIGTTTVGVQLVALPGGKVLATVSDYNDQVKCGLDVIGRINYAKRDGNLEELRSLVLETINRLVQRAVVETKVKKEQIQNAYISGNTTMIHLLLGLKPEYIRLEPYTPTVYEVPILPAHEVGIDVYPFAPVSISPAVGSYVGGDIAAGLLCTELVAASDDLCLFMDIGTNGELVVGNREFVMACACSAGPAFEGGGIDCGMYAAKGAIDRVAVDPNTGEARYSVIGNVLPKGICGSGMISLLAELFRTGWIDAAGKLNRKRHSRAIHVDGRRGKYTIVPDSKNASAIQIGETEIESIIRAKAAVYSACDLMLDQVGASFSDLARVYVAGGFGRFLDVKSAKTIGLIPDLPEEKFHFLGNSSLIGTYMALVSQEHREKLFAIAQRITYLELNVDPTYMDHYTGALFLPHTDSSRFPSVKVAEQTKE
ncbi:MAG: ASKHA domain-containing protein [Pseudomonadota bacterium]